MEDKKVLTREILMSKGPDCDDMSKDDKAKVSVLDELDDMLADVAIKKITKGKK